eukprot:CAMPEP_0202339922 /NCGR_PEP_ID=MMETSP1126-20121109/1577_1 /ASSEMBLY_ACC=CAM_ASM_000457 /TAXON_ID=3047 /ORGANISM="Dunaliella tertiolecta, Strain CCMP1320" /LENGTH=38 /DNA_ID= /DNA_START= /DNA_END= /DNA_ORIENTATION=
MGWDGKRHHEVVWGGKQGEARTAGPTEDAKAQGQADPA